MNPWFKGFKGDIIPQPGDKGNYKVRGLWNINEHDQLEITELPVGKWTGEYKHFLNEMAEKGTISDFTEHHLEN